MMKSVVLLLAVSGFSFLSGCGPASQGSVHRSQMSETECLSACAHDYSKGSNKCSLEKKPEGVITSECEKKVYDSFKLCNAKCYGNI